MKLTNKHGIPETFVNVLRRPTYSKGKAHRSVTQLINSPKIVALSEHLSDELEQDVSDMVWSLFGQAVHKVLEHGKDSNHVIEERLHTSVDGWTISGAVDLQVIRDNGIGIRDYKTTSAWAVMNDKAEWEQQLNIYAWLVEEVKKMPVVDLGIVAIIRDWSRRDADKKDDYPPAPVKELPITMWTQEERLEFIKHRIHKHAEAQFALDTDSPLPPCTPEEMWEKPTVWAVMKKGGVRAKALFGDELSAISEANRLGGDYEVKTRYGERTRCANFCQVNTWCAQWRDYQDGVRFDEEQA
jgi:PD-(D/E)XK nuclease superfamily